MRPIGIPPQPVNIDGFFLPAYEKTDQPAYIMFQGVLFLPIFSTVEKLEEFLPLLSLFEKTKVKHITDGLDFLDSVRGKSRVMLDPYYSQADNKTRWTEVFVEDCP